MATAIGKRIEQIVAGFENDGATDLRSRFASRLPILVMLDFFGFPDEDEALFRGWYDSFEAALANVMRAMRISVAPALQARRNFTIISRRRLKRYV